MDLIMKPKPISPTASEQYADCKRKWGFRYLDGLRTPPKPSAQVGTRVHEIIEGWLQYGTPPDEQEVISVGDRVYYPGKIAARGLHMLPPPNPGHGIEAGFEFGRWAGRIDLIPAREEWKDGVPAVFDHKTSTDPKAWGKSPEDLTTDTQAIVYAKAILDATGSSEVDLQWSYFQTREPYQARQSRVRLNVLQVNSVFEHLDALAAEIQYVASFKDSGLRGAHLPPTVTSCQKFGGCDYQSICEITPQERLRGFMTQTMSFAERVKLLREGAATAPDTVAAPAVATAPTLPMVVPTDWQPDLSVPGYEISPSTGQRRQQHRDARPEDLEAIKAAFMEHKSPGDIAAHLGIFVSHVEAVIAHYSAQWVPEKNAFRVNPPEEPKTLIANPDQQTSAVAQGPINTDPIDAMEIAELRAFIAEHKLPVDAGRRRAPAVRELVKIALKDLEVARRLGETAPELAVVAQPAPAAAQPATTTAPRQLPIVLVDTRTMDVVEDYEPEVTTLAQTGSLTIPTFDLYVDCLPKKLPPPRRVSSLREVFAAQFNRIERAHGVADYRLVENGAAQLSAALRASEDDETLCHEIVTISTSTAEGRDLLETLSELATTVVVGI
jgi:hypothetical protein